MNTIQYQKINPEKLATYFANLYAGQFFLSSDTFNSDAKKKLMQVSNANINKIANAINEAISKKFAVNSKQTVLLSNIYHQETKESNQYFVNVKVYEKKCHTDFLVSEGTYTCFIF